MQPCERANGAHSPTIDEPVAHVPSSRCPPKTTTREVPTREIAWPYLASGSRLCFHGNSQLPASLSTLPERSCGATTNATPSDVHTCPCPGNPNLQCDCLSIQYPVELPPPVADAFLSDVDKDRKISMRVQDLLQQLLERAACAQNLSF